MKLKKSVIIFVVLISSFLGLGLGYIIWKIESPKVLSPIPSEAGGSTLADPNDPCSGELVDHCGVCQSSGSCTIQQPACSQWMEEYNECKDGGCHHAPRCSGGAVLSDNKTYNIGDKITVTGYAAALKNQIKVDQIEFYLDGKFVKDLYPTRGGCPAGTVALGCVPGSNYMWGFSHTFTSTKKHHDVKVQWYTANGDTDVGCTGTNSYQLNEINVCDGGGLVTNDDKITLGDPITITGWAYDKDGIDKDNVLVKIDGVDAGKATTSDGCPLGSIDCKSSLPNVVSWSYTFTSTEIAQTASVSWKDTLGKSGPNCTAKQTYDIQEVNPNWDLTKTSSGVCDKSDPDNMFIPIIYTIVATNNSTAAKSLTKIVDQLDNKVQKAWIVPSSISPSIGVISGNTITWNLEGELASFEPGEQLQFTYQVNIPDDNFGTYLNIVTATPADDSGSFTASRSTFAQCEQPITGIFNSTISKIIASGVLVISALLYTLFDGENMRITKRFLASYKLDRKRSGFEDDF